MCSCYNLQMNSFLKSSLMVEIPGHPEQFNPNPLPHWELVGTVCQGDKNSGALYRNPRSGIYIQVNAFSFRQIDQAKVIAAIDLAVAVKPPDLTHKHYPCPW